MRAKTLEGVGNRNALFLRRITDERAELDEKAHSMGYTATSWARATGDPERSVRQRWKAAGLTRRRRINTLNEKG